MIRDDVCYLIAEPTHGLFDASERSERMVFCQIRSVTSADYWRSREAGVDPVIVFVLSEYADYHGERLIRYGEGKESRFYNVVRTYVTDHSLEITAEEGKGYVGNPYTAEEA